MTFEDGYINNYFFLSCSKRTQDAGGFFALGKTIAENVALNVNKIYFTLVSADVKEIKKGLLGKMEFYRGSFEYPDMDDIENTYVVESGFEPWDIVFAKQMLWLALPEELWSIIATELLELWKLKKTVLLRNQD